MMRLHLHGMGGCALGAAGEPFVEGLGRVADVPIKQYAKPAARRRYGRLTKLVTIAAQRAIADAGVEDPGTLAVVTATAMGELSISLELVCQIHATRGATISPSLVPSSVLNAPAGHLTIALDDRRPAITVSQGWLSAEAGLAAAADLLADGVAEQVLVVAGDEVDPGWIDRLEQAGADAWSAQLTAEAFQEGALALVLGREPGGRRLGSVCGAVERAGDPVRGVRRLVERCLGGPDGRPEVRVRHGAGGDRLLEVVAEALGRPASELVRDGAGLGSSQAGAFAVLFDRLATTDATDGADELLLIGAEVDEIAVLHWRR
jgi:hypothetical protein